jgi:glucans biosynthesis protein
MNQNFETRLRNLRQAPRCGAKTRAGGPCQCPAIRGRTRCRLHGGWSPDAQRGARNGNFKDGDWTAEAIEERKLQLSQAPRCGARTRAGTPCQCPAIRDRTRCRLHGGLSPGAPKGSRNGNYKNGEWTTEAIEERKWLRNLVRSFGKPG